MAGVEEPRNTSECYRCWFIEPAIRGGRSEQLFAKAEGNCQRGVVGVSPYTDWEVHDERLPATRYCKLLIQMTQRSYCGVSHNHLHERDM
jgi:hypothetical protein